MQYSKFVVNNDPWCLWDWDLAKSNLDFLNSIDPTFFEYLARAYVNSSGTDNNDHSVALALRTTYSQSLETFFAFLFAAIQAPDCPLGWVHKYWPSDIEHLLQKMRDNQPILSKLDITPFTWQNIANTILAFEVDDKEKEKRIKQGFALAWERFAEDFLEPSFRPEYNSIKHGLRVKSGGFRIQIGRENIPGVPVPATHLLGKSEFGSTFFTIEPLDIEAADKSKRQFRLLKHSIGWQPEKFHLGIHLISLSLQNVVSFLKIVNGMDGSQVQFSWPDNETHFQEPWKTYSGLSGLSINNDITPAYITPFTKEQILATYKKDVEESD